ncbi:P-loop containing nucleoside triphosphate hydrolase protein [Melampsora americana]|nr:P-loop containing nucleoside triphosphate hydrolase protein [Melampsora americana]
MIVCPVTLVKNWAREMNKWLGRSRLNMFVADGKSNIKHFTSSPYYNIIIIGYERLRTLSQEINVVYPPIGLIIADEGHRLKSIEAKTTQALRTLKTQRRVVLSGTPIQNNLNEYYAMVDFVNPGILSDLKSFKKKFEQPIAKSREPGSTPSQKALGRSRAEELAELSDSYVLRRGSDVISHHLPPRHDYCLFIDLAAAQKKIYAATLASPEIRAVFSGESSQQLVLINTLKKLCNSAGLLMNETSIQNLAKNSSTLFPSWVTRNDIKLSGKMIALASFLKILHEKTDEKIILVSNFTSTLDVIEAHCRSQNYSLCRLDGKTPQNKRDDIVQTFNRMTARSQFVFLLSSKSGGVGLNLIGASRLILFDSDWNPATDLQAMARIWRQGQKKACHIYRFLATGTIDECIFQRQVTKTGLATDLIKDAGVSREVLDRGNTFTSDELKRLFELHTGTPCHTHDLLGCRCFETKTTDEVAEDAAGQAESDSDSLPEASQMFQPATQYKPSNLQKEPKKLAELETWDHINTSLSDSLEELDDSILYDTIVDLKSKHVESDDEDEDSNENVRSTTKGGEITFVFHKTNTILGSTANSDVEVQCV